MSGPVSGFTHCPATTSLFLVYLVITVDDSDSFINQLLDHLEEGQLMLTEKFNATGVELGTGDQLPNLVDVHIGKIVIVRCELVHICHTAFTKGDIPAALIVILFMFRPKTNCRRFKQASISITFSCT